MRLSRMLRELRYAVRSLLTDPWITVVTILVLAIAIGSNSTIFSIANALLLRPLPFHHPDQLVEVWNTQVKRGIFDMAVSHPDFVEWQDQAGSFEQMAAFAPVGLNITGEDGAERVAGASVSANFFDVLGVRPLMGRTFLPGENYSAGTPVVILSYKLWQRRYHGAGNVLGQTLMLNNRPHTVVGVIPRDLEFPEKAELWTPVIFDLREGNRQVGSLNVVARLRQGETLGRAQSDMERIEQGIKEQHRGISPDRDVKVVSRHEQLTRNARQTVIIIYAVVCVLLLVACFNVASLLLARTTRRRGEFVLRSALGAGRLQLARQLLVESLILSLAGGLVGLLFAYWALDSVLALLPDDFPTRVKEVRLDRAVVIWNFAVAVVTSLLLCVGPYLQATKINLSEALKQSERSLTGDKSFRRRFSFLIIAETALTMVLLICAGLVVKSLLKLHEVDLGFNPQNVVLVTVTMPDYSYKEPAQKIAYARQLLERLKARPGVVNAGATSILPLGPGVSNTSFEIEGRPNSPERLYTNIRAISPDYLQTMRIALKSGRYPTPQDDEQGAPICLVNEEMAGEYWPGESPLGKSIRVFGRLCEIQGVVGNVKSDSVSGGAEAETYLPFYQMPTPYLTFVVRGAGSPDSLIPVIRREFEAMDRNQPLIRLQTMEQLVSGTLAQQNLAGWLTSAFAVTALLLVSIGVYGIISYVVSQKTREIGLRMALGARPFDVIKQILRQVSLVGVAGVAIGLLLSLAATRVIASLLYGVSTADPSVMVGASLLLTGVIVLASFLPARRAARVDPASILRS